MKSIWPKIPSPFVRAMLAGHSALGLAFAALIFIVCLTGTVAVLAYELHGWERPQAPQVESVTPQAMERLAREAIARHEGVEHLYITPPNEHTRQISVYVDLADTEADPELLADAEGRLVEDAHAPWTDFLINLHIYLHLPQSWGMFLVGMTGVALLSSLVSGIFAHPRIFRDSFNFRVGGSKRLQEADLHNRIGIWGLPFHIIISLTGALLGLTTIILGFLALALFQGDMGKAYSLFIPEVLTDNPAPAPLPSLQPMFDTVARELPGSTVTQVLYEHPGEQGQGVMIIAEVPRELSRGSSFIFDGDGKLLSRDVIEEASAGVQVLQAVSTLHFGWFGGWWIKIVYILLGAGLTAVTSSGVAIWLARRRDKGRPAPRCERVWIAFVWSQPFALAVSALLALLTPTIEPLITWSVATLAANTLAFALRPPAISFGLRAATALALLAVVGVHIALNGGAYADPAAWGINVTFAACAVLLLVSLRLRATPAPATTPAETPA